MTVMLSATPLAPQNQPASSPEQPPPPLDLVLVLDVNARCKPFLVDARRLF